MYKIDFHTHSHGSPDGALTVENYKHILETGRLDYVAITDHNRIDTAEQIRADLKDLGERIIIGEEITCIEGELIGLYLTQAVPAGLSAREAAERVKAQGGYVYVPHPFETVRSGLPIEALDSIAEFVDIVETHNGRAVFQNRGTLASTWSKDHGKAQAASSDSHGQVGWGRTYTEIYDIPTRVNLVTLLNAATYAKGKVGVGILYPKFNRILKALKRP